jgi:hypothetical protein
MIFRRPARRFCIATTRLCDSLARFCKSASKSAQSGRDCGRKQLVGGDGGLDLFER